MKPYERFKQFSAWAMFCLTGLCANAALAQATPPGMDGAAVPSGMKAALQVATPTQVAPDFPAQRFELPPTMPPLAVAPEREWGPRQIGYVRPLPAGARPTEAWMSKPGEGAVLRVEFTSVDAKGLRLKLRGELNGVELRVYDPRSNVVLGPYTYFPGFWEEGEEPSWWTPMIDGESIGLEFFQRGGVPQSLPAITEVAYDYEDPSEDEDLLSGGGCIMDATCFPAWASDGRAVGRMLFTDAGGTFTCTGAMLNRTSGDFAPIFMTARHCINNQNAANSLEIRWNYQSATCNGPVPDLSTVPRNNAALLLKLHHDSDWSLLGLVEPSRADFFAGWDPNYLGTGSATTGIHHPGGRPKKIHFANKDFDTSCFTADHEIESNQQYHVIMSSGAARRGSSGSPLFDANHRVRGTMSCGPAGRPEPLTCPPNEWKTYGRLDAAFRNVRWYISDMANPSYADSTFIGDPGQDGDRERGTITNPFTTVYKASFAVPSGGDVLLSPGTYHEHGTVTISRPMTLRSRGGLVTITQ